MPDYKALCSDCPKCGKENIVFLAHKFRKIGVKDAHHLHPVVRHNSVRLLNQSYRSARKSDLLKLLPRCSTSFGSGSGPYFASFVTAAA